jgi:hypothetical protein
VVGADRKHPTLVTMHLLVTHFASLLLAASPTAGRAPSTEAERAALVLRATRDQLAAFLRDTPPEVLLAVSERAIDALSSYTYVMAKQERVQNTLLEEQVIHVSAKESPFAVRMEFLRGPSSGRVVLYNGSVNPGQFRVREAGFLSFAGPLWIPLDSPFAKLDSNHTANEAGLGSLVRRLRRELARATLQGGVRVTDEGWTASGHYCQLYVMPNGGRGFGSARTRLCTDPSLGIPVRVESYDGAGALTERFVFSEIKHQPLPDAVFDPQGV